MNNEQLTRLSLIDGSIESIQSSENNQPQKELEPTFEEIIVQVLTLEGLEQTVQKRIVGYKKGKYE